MRLYKRNSLTPVTACLFALYNEHIRSTPLNTLYWAGLFLFGEIENLIIKYIHNFYALDQNS